MNYDVVTFGIDKAGQSFGVKTSHVIDGDFLSKEVEEKIRDDSECIVSNSDYCDFSYSLISFVHLEIDDVLIKLGVHPRSTYVVVGRVSDEDNIMLFVDANDAEAAKERFLTHLKVAQAWNGRSDIYVDFCIKVSDSTIEQVYTSNATSDIFTF